MTITTASGSTITYTPSAAGVNWGDITGTLSNQTDLQNELDNRLQFYTLQLSDIASISGTTYTFTSDFRSKVISKKYRIEIPAGFVANDVS